MTIKIVEQADRPMTLNLMMPAGTQPDLKPRITVFGVGGAGGNAVNNTIFPEYKTFKKELKDHSLSYFILD